MYINNTDHMMTKMASIPINGKKPFKNLLQNCWTNFNKTWHVALWTKSTAICTQMTLCILQQGQFRSPMHLNEIDSKSSSVIALRSFTCI